VLTEYIQLALSKAHYKIIEDPNPFFGWVEELPGCWANGPTLEACREELREVIEDWILITNRLGEPLPVIDW